MPLATYPGAVSFAELQAFPLEQEAVGRVRRYPQANTVCSIASLRLIQSRRAFQEADTTWIRDFEAMRFCRQGTVHRCRRCA